MRSSLSLLVLPSLLVFGCGGSSKKPTKQPDMSMAMKADMTVGDGCTQIDTWPNANVLAFSDTTQSGFPFVDGVYDEEPNATDATHSDELLYRWYQETGMPTPMVPHDYDISEDDTFGTCIDCVTALIDFDPNDTTSTGTYYFAPGERTNTGTFYFATSGSIHISHLDHGSLTGTVAASGTMLHLVHWDYDYAKQMDEADPDGKCIDVASFDFTAPFDNTSSDGGVDSGT